MQTELDEVLPTFLLESRELLAEMEAALLRIARGERDTESVNAIFRAAHTIKGSAGLFGLDAVVRFTHIVEGLLDAVRGGEVAISEPLTQLLLACADHIGAMVDCVERGQPGADTPALTDAGDALIERMKRQMPGTAQAPGASDDRRAASTAALASDACTSNGDGQWHISVQFGANVLRNGMDPLSFLRYLATLGTVKNIVTHSDAVPGLSQLDPEACYLGCEITFEGPVDRGTLLGVFDFVADESVIDVVAPNSRAEAVPEELVPVQTAVAPLRAPPVDTHKPAAEARASEGKSVRVDADKLDRLINLVGELITVTAGAALIARRSSNVEMQESTSTLAGLVEEVRDSALQLRMVKIGATFGRFQRVVHDVARELGKDIELRTSGEDTELDKTLVEKIGDPLLHLVRNAIDHGIDPVEVRAARGKPARGTVTLNAYHDSGSIVIEVSDDGHGLDRDKILAKAIERGLVEQGKPMSDAEVYALIFEPGFSTAAVVTNLSGRGVGMDVVKRNITALRGSVSLVSSPGLGTTVTVRLPLTLAIIDGFLVMVGNAVFVVPLDMVDECVTYGGEADRDYTDLRGHVLPFIRLRELFDIPGRPTKRQNIVVVEHAGRKVGLLVDQLVGEAQTVIKPLSRMFEHVKGISGSSILGTGEVALILDVPGLMQRFEPAAQASVPLRAD
jgi:two-component system chemotaxis sensor kinase CheA